MLSADTLTEGTAGKQETCGAAMEIDYQVKPAGHKPNGRFHFVSNWNDFVEVSIALKARRKTFFDEDRNSEPPELLLKSTDWSSEEKAVPHRTETY